MIYMAATQFELTADLYFLKDGKNEMAYAPLEKKVFLLDNFNKKILTDLKDKKIIKNPGPLTEMFLKHCQKIGIVNGKKHEFLKEITVDWSKKPYHYLPTAASILPTFNCNLRCLYCFSDSGQRKKNLDLEIALAVVDFIVKNCLTKKTKKFSIEFTGGGEPTLNWSTLVQTIKYARRLAKKNKLKSEITVITNGLLSDKKLNWLVKKVDHIAVSFDGVKEIQDLQRPLANGDGSFDRVFNTIKKLDKIGFDYKLKLMLTEKSILKMSETMEFLCKNLKARKASQFRFGLFYPCERSQKSNVHLPSPKQYYQIVKKMQKKAREFGLNITDPDHYYVSRLQSYNCGLETNFVVTPEGFVSTCAFVDKRDDPRSKDFFIGKYDFEKKKFIIDEKKRRKLLRPVQNIPNCSSCFVKWHCCGACAVQVALQTGDMFKTNGYHYCKYIKPIIKKGLVNQLKKEGLVNATEKKP